jgi:hypothetical protein
MAKLVKLQKSEQIVDIIKKIKTLKSDEVVFEIPDGSPLFKNPHNFELIKKSAAAMGKTVIMRTEDPAGKSMIAKAGLLMDEGGEFEKPVVRTKTRKVKFSDIGATTMPRGAAGALPPVPPPADMSFRTRPAPPTAAKTSYLPSLPKFRVPGLATNFSRFFVLGAVILVLVVFGLAVLLPQAQITVYARSEPIMRDLEVSVDKNTRSINSSNLTVPGIAISREISHTKNFPATGVKLAGNKATGQVQLFNFTKNTLTLRAATTTLVVDGKKYSFTKDVTGLRPTARIGQGGEQEIDQSSLIPPVSIVAQEVGANFNIGADLRLTIQNAALGQADVYAETAGNITGGSSTETKVLSQADIDKATQTMQDELGPLAEEELKAAGQQDVSLRILPNAVKSEVLAKTANKEVNDEVPDFDMTIIAKVTGVGFNEEDVKNLVLEKINSVLSEDKYLLEDGRQELTATFKTVNIDNGTGVLAVHFETIAAYRVENTNLSRILAGKDAVEIQEILLTKPEIDRVDVTFSPFFVKKAPRFNGKIFIKTVQSENNPK